MSIRILRGDVRDMLKTLDADSVDCVVTSPPYWGLRDYGVAGQIGMESILGEHIAVLVEVFREVRRVLKPMGTLWVNYGDCYATSVNGRSAAATKAAGTDDRTFRDKPFSTVQGNLKPKDLCMVANRLAIALQDDGWWVRAENIWGKPNPMPDSSGRYRPSTAHEKVWLLTKCAKSYYDSEAVRMPPEESTVQRLSQDVESQTGSARANAGGKTNGNMKAVGRTTDKQRGHSWRHASFNDRWDAMPVAEQRANGRLFRNYEPEPWNHIGFAGDIWHIAPVGFAEAHFATFPPALVEPCIASGAPLNVCADCGAPIIRVIQEKFIPQGDVSPEKGIRFADGQKAAAPENSWGGSPRGITAVETLGFQPSCACAAEIKPATVLDPFGGAGTTGLVADRMGRDAILIELNPEYADIAERRIKGDSPLFAEVA